MRLRDMGYRFRRIQLIHKFQIKRTKANKRKTVFKDLILEIFS